MGLADVYPFVLADRVIAKLKFVHEVVERAGHGMSANIAPDVQRAAVNRALDAAELLSPAAAGPAAELNPASGAGTPRS